MTEKRLMVPGGKKAHVVDPATDVPYACYLHRPECAPPDMDDSKRILISAGATGGVFVDIGAGAGDRPIDREGFYEWVIGLIEDRLALAEDVRSRRRKACRLDVAIDSGGEYGVAEVGEDPGAWLLPGYRRCGVTAYLRVPEIDETEADD